MLTLMMWQLRTMVICSYLQQAMIHIHISVESCGSLLWPATFDEMLTPVKQHFIKRANSKLLSEYGWVSFYFKIFCPDKGRPKSTLRQYQPATLFQNKSRHWPWSEEILAFPQHVMSFAFFGMKASNACIIRTTNVLSQFLDSLCQHPLPRSIWVLLGGMSRKVSLSVCSQSPKIAICSKKNQQLMVAILKPFMRVVKELFKFERCQPQDIT